MTMTMDGILDPDEGMRLLEMVPTEVDDDFWVMIESKGKAIEGESSRHFEDGKPRMPVSAFRFQMDVATPPGSSKGKMRVSHLFLVRPCDAASASIACLLRDQVLDIKLILSVFKASGDGSSDMQPHLEFEMKDGRLKTHTMMTGRNTRRPTEILEIAFNSFEIRSAPQQHIGLRGAVRTCTVNM